VGDVVRVAVVIENRDDGYQTVPLEIFAKLKVASPGNGTAKRRIPRASAQNGLIFLSTERGHP
jgi:hypothetical protein